MNIVLRFYRHLNKRFWIKQFSFFDISSAIGRNGVGKGCKLSGMEHMIIGKNCFFGEGTELVALGNHFKQKLDGTYDESNPDDIDPDMMV